MSNLAAALGWALVDLVEHPDWPGASSRPTDSAIGPALRLESTRLAQRSIMTRTVLSAVQFDTGAVTYGAAGLDHRHAAAAVEHIRGAGPGTVGSGPVDRHRLTEQDALPSPMLVTAFGHGRHSCPAQPFSLAAMTAATTHLLAQVPRWRRAGRRIRARPGPDRWCGAGGGTVPGRLRRAR